jgi:hypothetical protein
MCSVSTSKLSMYFSNRMNTQQKKFIENLNIREKFRKKNNYIIKESI